MNYRHLYHAGNFADVLKHVLLTRIVEYLKRKDKPFRVIDTHAGTGLYDLSSEEAQKTGEWRDGIGRLLESQLDPTVAPLLAPYLDAVASVNPDGALQFYPGSPRIARHLLRRGDRLTAIEKHPADFETLKANFADDFQTRAIELDGWLALGAHLPPKEKRGLVLVDPPFEEQGEFERLASGLIKAWRRWPGGIYALWYPIKDVQAVIAFRKRLADSGVERIFDISLETDTPGTERNMLHGSGIVIVNPPFVLEAELNTILPALAKILSRNAMQRWRASWITADART